MIRLNTLSVRILRWGIFWTGFFACSLFAQFKAVAKVQVETYFNDPDSLCREETLRILCVPLPVVRVSYMNETRKVVTKEFPDSFYVDAVNDLIAYECTKYFTPINTPENTAPTNTLSSYLSSIRYSVLKKDTLHFDSVSQAIRETAQRVNADLVLLPYACVLKNIVFQQNSWRDQSSNTARPIKYKASASIHIQIWDKNGRLLYEKIGHDQTMRPVLYSIFRKRKIKKNEDMAAFSGHTFAPTLIRSLSESIRMAMEVRPITY